MRDLARTLCNTGQCEFQTDDASSAIAPVVVVHYLSLILQLSASSEIKLLIVSAIQAPEVAHTNSSHAAASGPSPHKRLEHGTIQPNAINTTTTRSSGEPTPPISQKTASRILSMDRQ